MFVAKCEERLNVADRVVLVLPDLIASHPGFYEAVHAVKTVANQLGVPLTCLITGDRTEEYKSLVTTVEPEMAVDVASITGGRSLASSLNDRVVATDLVVAMSPREEARGWQPSLRNLPNKLETIDAENVVLDYPSEEDVSDKRRFL